MSMRRSKKICLEATLIQSGLTESFVRSLKRCRTFTLSKYCTTTSSLIMLFYINRGIAKNLSPFLLTLGRQRLSQMFLWPRKYSRKNQGTSPRTDIFCLSCLIKDMTVIIQGSPATLQGLYRKYKLSCPTDRPSTTYVFNADTSNEIGWKMNTVNTV